MASKLQALRDKAKQTQTVDMTEEGTGGGGGGLMPEGYALARVVKYIELGQQPQTDPNGKSKAPAREFIVGFKLFGGEDGCYDDRFIETFGLAISNSPKANAKKLFDALNYSGKLEHPSDALGEGYLVPILVKKNKAGKDVNRIDIAGILPPIEPVSKKKYDIPGVTDNDLRYFFFDAPDKESWDALFIDGKWDDGNSKNRYQDTILTALDFPGSELEQMLSGVVLPEMDGDDAQDAEEDEEEAPPMPTPAKGKGGKTPPKMPAMPMP